MYVYMYYYYYFYMSTFMANRCIVCSKAPSVTFYLSLFVSISQHGGV